jgi:hypothetical protein
MFVAPLSLPASGSLDRPPVRLRRMVLDTRGFAKRFDPRPLLLVWLLFGSVALLLFPDVCLVPRFGATLPFWLVAAPAIDLAWLMRSHLPGLLRSVWPSRGPRRRRCQARRAPPAQSTLRMRRERSSRK